MCTHHHKKTYINGLSPTCIITDYAANHNINLPTDKKEKCLFHSTDLAWKRANNCGEKFWEVLHQMSKDETLEDIDFREFILTDLVYDEAYGSESGSIPMKGEGVIVIAKAHLKKPLRMQGAKFYGNVLIQDLECEEAVDFDEAVFKGVVTIERCRFKGMVSFINNCRFEHNVIFEDCFFEESFDFHNVVAMQQIMFSMVTFGAEALFVGLNQIAEDLICSFTEVYFNAYTSFSNAGFNSSLAFDNCHFLGETHFENTAFRKRVQFLEPKFGEKAFFRATKPGVKLFENAVDFEVINDSFEGVGQLIFENVNLFNFDVGFKNELRALEVNHKVDIREGCLLYRTAIERRFKYTRFNKIIIEDLTKAFIGYFESFQQQSLQVDIKRDLKTEAIVILYHTEDNLTIPELAHLIHQTKADVLNFMVEPEKQINQLEEKALAIDFFLKFQSLWERYGIARKNNSLNLPIIEAIMTGDEKTISTELKDKFDLTVNIYIENLLKDNRLEAGGNIHIGHLTKEYFSTKNKTDE